MLAHSTGFVFIGARNAVQLFYMISGFLISYVLVERKAYATLKSFYINRYLRLYPLYLCVALLTLLALTAARMMGKSTEFFSTYAQAPSAATALLVVSNTTLLLQDWVMFAGVRYDSLVPTLDFRSSDILLYHGLLVPQAWTLGVELTFYLIAPFVLVRRRLIGVLLAASVALRVWLLSRGIGFHDPWTYRFFPTELALFLLGALAHQLLLPYYRKTLPVVRMQAFAWIATCTFIGLTLAYGLIPHPGLIKTGMLFAVFLLLMPLAFVFQGTHRWDQWIGELSYPIYIGHALVINTLLFVWANGAAHVRVLGIGAVMLSILFAMALNHWIARPVEGLRARFRSVS